MRDQRNPPRQETKLEQWGTVTDFLGARLCDVQGPSLIRKKGPVWLVEAGWPHPPSTQSMIAPPDAKQMIASYLPNEIKVCAHYHLSRKAAVQNDQDVEQLMNYPGQWWKPVVHKHTDRWGI